MTHTIGHVLSVVQIWTHVRNVIVNNYHPMTITNQCKGMTKQMFKGLRNDSFVCLDDISEHPETMNYVIYNPNKQTKEERVELLYRKIKEAFDVDLSSDELNRLTSYDVFELKKICERT